VGFYLSGFSGIIAPSALSGNQNNYNPTGLDTAAALRVDPGAAARVITGLAGGSEGRVLILVNSSTTAGRTLTLNHQDASSTAANRFIGKNLANVVINPGACAILWYDATDSRWRIAGE
jgi:hypothetical protein